MAGVKIEVPADYTLQEYRDYHFFLYYGNGITGVLNVIGAIAITGFAAMILIGKAMSGDWHFKFVEIAMLVMEAYILSVPFIILADTKQTLTEDKYRSENGKLVITPESIELASDTSGARITWEKISRAYITKKAIYLEYSKLNAVIIPKRMLENDVEQNLVKLVREKVRR